MSHYRSWTSAQLKEAVKTSKSLRQVIAKLGLVPAGGNYVHIAKAIYVEGLDTSHFKGHAWNKGLRIPKEPIYTLEEILVVENHYNSYRLKQRLFKEGLKTAKCEECGWAQVSPDGRIPVEIDHINGIHSDNRIENLRILCPNCHSLKPTHRGRNKNAGRSGGIGQTHRA